MKNSVQILFGLALVLALPAQLRAQEFKQKFNSPTNRKVVLDMRGSDVTVEGYDGDELVIRGSGHFEDSPALTQALKQGLRPVYSTGSDNTRLGLAVTPTEANTIRVARTSRSDGHYTVRLPRANPHHPASRGGSGVPLRRFGCACTLPPSLLS